MIRHRKKKADELRKRLAEAEQQKQEVIREGRANQPRLLWLKQQLKDNYIAERLIAGMEQTRRRHA